MALVFGNRKKRTFLPGHIKIDVPVFKSNSVSSLQPFSAGAASSIYHMFDADTTRPIGQVFA